MSALDWVFISVLAIGMASPILLVGYGQKAISDKAAYSALCITLLTLLAVGEIGAPT